MLELSEKFFSFLNRSGIKYCHWKSNCRLAKGLEGKTDLDLLVAMEDQKAFEAALPQFDFRKVLTDPRRRIADVEDYLGFDKQSGRLIHLHVHYRLVLGERFIKNHVLPIEPLIFDNLVTEMGVRIPCPEIELLLLIIRAHMKIGALSFIRYVAGQLIGKKNAPYPADIVDEIRDLAARCDHNKFSRLLALSGIQLDAEAANRSVEVISKGRLRPLDVLAWRRLIMRAMRRYRKETGIQVRFKYYAHCLRALPVLKRFFSVRKKTLAGPGRIISIIGADGSGKSTLVKELNSWLSWKLDVRKAYYGVPKTGVVRAWRVVIRALTKLGLHSLAGFAGRLYHVYVANKRYRIYKRTLEAASTGSVVITDRFPMTEFNAMDEPMDGPRLTNARGFMSGLFSRAEARQYGRITHPDRIFVLRADVSVLHARKGDVPFEQHKAKADAVNSIKPSSTIKLVDAASPYKQVLLDVKAGIWEVL